MLKQMSVGHFAFTFLGILSSVMSEEGFLTNTFGYDSLPLILSTFMEKCPEHFGPPSCRYRNELRHKIDDFESSNIFKTKQIKELKNKTSGKEIPEEISTEEISIEIPLVDLKNRLHKRFTIFRRKNPTARGYKRGPGFRSWGGKRDTTFLEQNLDKKSKFASWGGKRDGEFSPGDSMIEKRDLFDKRPKFQNWGGKKRTNDFMGEIENEESVNSNDQIEKRKPIWKNVGYYLSEPFKKHVPKRPQFQSWGGKRAMYPWRKFFTLFQQKPALLLNGEEKRKFSSWGGKRYDGNVNQDEEENFKRHAFQNWGGKREMSDTDSFQDVRDVFALKESELKDKANQRNKEVMTNWNNDEPHSDFNYWGDELKNGKDGR